MEGIPGKQGSGHRFLVSSLPCISHVYCLYFEDGIDPPRCENWIPFGSPFKIEHFEWYVRAILAGATGAS